MILIFIGFHIFRVQGVLHYYLYIVYDFIFSAYIEQFKNMKCIHILQCSVYIKQCSAYIIILFKNMLVYQNMDNLNKEYEVYIQD